MKDNLNEAGIYNPTLYKKEVMKTIRLRLKKSNIEVLSSGFNKYNKTKWGSSHPIDDYLQVHGRLIAIEVRTRTQLEENEIKKIISDRFRPLSKKMKVIGIIESHQGFKESALKTISYEDNPVVLTQHNISITCNNCARWDKLVKKVLFPQLDNQKNREDTNQRNEKDYDMIACILSGSVRKKIYVRLLEEPSFAYEIAKKEKLHISSVSRAIHNLLQEGVIQRVSRKKKPKFVKLTPAAFKLKGDVLDRV
ncbi:MAG: hypothetical protein ACXADY_17185 [Candidatus Hodarchaeales archaeon]|jgi:ribosomal protein S25